MDNKLECFTIFEEDTETGTFRVSTESENPEGFWVELYSTHDDKERAILLKVSKEKLKELSEVLQAYCS